MTANDAIRAVCDAWERLDACALGELFTEDGVYEDPLKAERLVGRTAIVAANAAAMRDLRDCRIELTHVLDGGELGFAEGTFIGPLASGEGSLQFRFAIVAELRDGLISRLGEYFDSASAVQA